MSNKLLVVYSGLLAVKVAPSFPDFKVIGAGASLTGMEFDESTDETTTRSGLFWPMVRIVRLVRPLYWIMENVAAIFDGHLGIVLREVARSGYNAEWDCLSSARLGRGHIRERFYCVSYPNGKRLQRSQQRLQEDKDKGDIYASLFSPLPLRKAPSENDLPEPKVVGKDDGIPDRAHRIKGLGNSIDPELAEHIGHAITHPTPATSKE